jgi:hypothetical protein
MLPSNNLQKHYTRFSFAFQVAEKILLLSSYCRAGLRLCAEASQIGFQKKNRTTRVRLWSVITQIAVYLPSVCHRLPRQTTANVTLVCRWIRG